MFRIVKESYYNYKNDFLVSNATDDIRYKMMEPFEMIFNVEKWTYEKVEKTEDYKKVAEILYYIKENINELLDFNISKPVVKSVSIVSILRLAINSNIPHMNLSAFSFCTTIVHTFEYVCSLSMSSLLGRVNANVAYSS
ncbi:MAG: hypothetical protein U9N10_10720, partial [Bacillota bacterium]|nr:hypothetical protein [Bacillota bacterium]